VGFHRKPGLDITTELYFCQQWSENASQIGTLTWEFEFVHVCRRQRRGNEAIDVHRASFHEYSTRIFQRSRAGSSIPWQSLESLVKQFGAFLRGPFAGASLLKACTLQGMILLPCLIKTSCIWTDRLFHTFQYRGFRHTIASEAGAFPSAHL
jgi:hypothetical protein